MTIRFMDHAGEQVELTITEFAEALSKGTVYGLSVRYYEAPHSINLVLANDADHQYHKAEWNPDAVKLAEYIRSLEEVNDDFEYIIAYSPNQVEIEEYVSMSFTRQGDTVLVEIH
jgi:hypothetical protein